MENTKFSKLNLMLSLIFEIIGMAMFYFYEYNLSSIALVLIGALLMFGSAINNKKLFGATIYALISTIFVLITLGLFAWIGIITLLALLNLVNLAICFFVIAISKVKKTVKIIPKPVYERDEAEKIKMGDEAEKIFRELERMEKDVSRLEKAEKEKAQKPKKKSVSQKKATKKVTNKKTTTTKQSSSRDANLVACMQEHEMVAVLRAFGKANSQENRKVIQTLCKTFKASKSKKPKNRDNFYAYLAKSKTFAKLEDVKKTKKTVSRTSTKAVKEQKKFTAVKNAKTFHLPSCNILLRQDAKNFVHYNSRQDAMGKGHRPCRVCNP